MSEDSLPPHDRSSPAFPLSAEYGVLNSDGASSHTATAGEDWGKVFDLTDRRRILNRIAQRNYREHFFGQNSLSAPDPLIGRELKGSLGDLERMSMSESPELEHQRGTKERPQSDAKPPQYTEVASHFRGSRHPAPCIAEEIYQCCLRLLEVLC